MGGHTGRGRAPAVAMSGTVRLGEGVEFDLIRRMLQQDASIRRLHDQPSAHNLHGGEILEGAGSDCAIIGGRAIAISVDASIEDVHFRRAWMTPVQIGYRAAAAALSDLAAAAASPTGLFVTLAVARADVPDFALSIMAGVSEAAASYGAALLGGDVSASPGPAMIDIVVAGEVIHRVSRTGAEPGDSVWVTGELGASAAAVREWSRDRVPPEAAAERFRRPAPRIAEARWLAERHLIKAALDLSDGLVGDAGHLAAAGGVRILLEEAQIPIAPPAREVAVDANEALALAIAGGEDYELCFAGDDEAVAGQAAAFREAFGIPITRVGRVVPGAGIAMLDASGNEAPPASAAWSHFAVE